MPIPKGYRKKFFKDLNRRTRPSALKLAKENRRRLNNSNDPKFVYETLATTLLAIGQIHPLSYTAVGDTDLTRNGSKVHATRIQINMEDQDVADGSLRMILFRDKAQHGTLPTVQEVLHDIDFLSFIDRKNINRFIVIRDILVPRTKNIITGTSNTYRFNARVNFNIHYIGDTAVEASAGANNIYLLVISDVDGTADDFSINSCVTYTD